jgi:hypothetical protein
MNMPEYLFPGVYVEEVPFNAEPIAGVDTDMTDSMEARLYRLRESNPSFPARGLEVEGKEAPSGDISEELLAEMRRVLSGLNDGKGVFALASDGANRTKAICISELLRLLRRDLYRIDLATVVSKYIGETEKNLRRLFDAAERSSAILFFDETDALFGKRSDVKDSHDRYANIEIGQLLDLLEQYSGIAVLASNSRSVICTMEERGFAVLHFPHGTKID